MKQGDDWGETQEDEDYNHWESSDVVTDNYEGEENYAIEGEMEEYQAEEEPLSQDSEDFDEDDQDNYSWHKGDKKPRIMDAYISEAQVMSCDVVDMLHTDLIQPGHRTICSAKVNLEINGRSSKEVKAKLDSCGSVSIAHENLMTKVKPARQYKLPPRKLRGIGGRTNLLNKIGVKQPNNEHCELLCYVFNETIGETKDKHLVSHEQIKLRRMQGVSILA